MNGRLVWRVVMALVLVAVVAGIGFAAFNAGYVQGGLESGKIVAPVGGAAPGFYGPWFYRPWGFGFGPLGCLFPLLGFFVLFAVLRGLFWRGGWGGHHHHGERGVPPMFEDWHRKAHGEPAPSAETPKA